MAAKKEVKKYLVEVASNPQYCGICAGGVQFANGKAEIPEGRMVQWFKEHEGYKVTEITEEAQA
jgi:hypothetical protein